MEKVLHFHFIHSSKHKKYHSQRNSEILPTTYQSKSIYSYKPYKLYDIIVTSINSEGVLMQTGKNFSIGLGLTGVFSPDFGLVNFSSFVLKSDRVL